MEHKYEVSACFSKTATNSSYGSERRIRISVAAFLRCRWSIYPFASQLLVIFCSIRVYTIAGFGTSSSGPQAACCMHFQGQSRRCWVSTFKWVFVSVADPNPDPPDPHVFGPPGSGSTSQRYGSGSGSCSGSGSFCHHAKIVRKPLIPIILLLFLTFFFFKWCKCSFKK